MPNTPGAISAIITTYNYARFVGPAIDSVLAQSTAPAEIVVVDDGSTDETAAVVERYLERGVRYVKQQRAGAGAARNRGLAETGGELVAFLDADDRWLPDKLARQLEHLRRYPQVGLVTGGEWHVFESGAPPRLVARRPAGAIEAFPRVLLENFIGNPSVVLARRECFRAAGDFDETLRLGQDWDMWIRIARHFPVGVVDGPLILFTKHDDSLTSGQTKERYESNKLIERRYIDSVQPRLRRSLIARGAHSMNDFYAGAAIVTQPGRRKQAFRLALRSLWLDPFYMFDLKAPLLLHAMTGPAAFANMSRWLHKLVPRDSPAE
ncbi:MAG: glycosyltransferase family 2 protein [Chloroflexia bacterium]